MRDLFLHYAILEDKNLTSDERFILSATMMYENITNEELKEWFGFSVSKVSKIISNLKKKGYIEVSYIYYTGGKGIEKRNIRLTEKVKGVIEKYEAE